MSKRKPGELLKELEPLLSRPQGFTASDAMPVIGYSSKDNAAAMLAKMVKRGQLHGVKLGHREKLYFRDQAAADACPNVQRKLIDKAKQRPQVRKPDHPVVRITLAKVGAKVEGAPIITKRTRITIDDTPRPTARWQTLELKPDAKWPSFADQWRQLRGQA